MTAEKDAFHFLDFYFLIGGAFFALGIGLVAILLPLRLLLLLAGVGLLTIVVIGAKEIRRQNLEPCKQLV